MVFTVLTTFIVLNLFVAVTVEAMNRRGHSEDEAGSGVAVPGAPTMPAPDATPTAPRTPAPAAQSAEAELLAELRAVRQQLAHLEQSLPSGALSQSGSDR